ncbi:MAG TPA: hypothetical protein VMP12_08915 [Candidatus Sulfotelmatobacter sp.]|nr:hypothetical protein [Candidatus Sulfotelmatobacter sp.]
MISFLALFSAKAFAATAGIVAVVSQLFQANDHTSIWLAFALAWIACALAAIASSSLVFRVAEVRKRITQHHPRRPRR